MKIHRKWSRFHVRSAAIMCAGILFIITANVNLFKPNLPKSKSLVSTQTTNKGWKEQRGGTKDVPPSRCNCSMKPWHASEMIASHLKNSLSWLNHTNVHQYLQKRHPNMPLELLTGAKNKRCSLLPTLFSIDWSNILWQRATIDSNNSFLLYSAIFDPQTGGKASIRLLSFSTNKSPPRAWCHIWFSSDAPPLPVRVSHIDHLDWQDKSSDRQMPYLLRCPLPPGTNDVPLAVSLTSKPCGQATNLLKVRRVMDESDCLEHIYASQVFGRRRREVSAYRNRKLPDNPSKMVKGWAAAVCGPALFYYHEDFSTRLVEWLELMRAQGFSQVFLHVAEVHPNIIKVLRHYTQEGFVEVTDYTYPSPYLNDSDLRKLWVMVERSKMFAQENMYFTDCILRHMHRYRFIAHFDPDEVPILPKHDNFTHLLDDLMASQKGKTPPAYKFQLTFFYDNLDLLEEAAHSPNYLWALRHTLRQAPHLTHPYPGRYKSLFDMNTVRGIYSHTTLVCVSGPCYFNRSMRVSNDTGFIGHYRNMCDKKCTNNTLHDLTLLKYKKQVGARVLEVLRTLRLL